MERGLPIGSLLVDGCSGFEKHLDDVCVTSICRFHQFVQQGFVGTTRWFSASVEEQLNHLGIPIPRCCP